MPSLAASSNGKSNVTLSCVRTIQWQNSVCYTVRFGLDDAGELMFQQVAELFFQVCMCGVLLEQEVFVLANKQQQ